MITKEPIAQPTWLEEGMDSMGKLVSLYGMGRIPQSILFFMVVTNCRRLLRAAYGSDLKAGWFLLGHGIRVAFRDVRYGLIRFWKFKVRMKSPEEEMRKFMEELESEEGDVE